MLLFKDIFPFQTHFEKTEILLLMTFKLFTTFCIQLLRLQAAFKGWKITPLYVNPETMVVFCRFHDIIAKFDRHHLQFQFLWLSCFYPV